jgi:hypothetical protein
MRVGIVATVREPGRPIESFVRYHLALGFQRVYLFFDSPDDPDRAFVPSDARVEVIHPDDRLRRQWRRTGLACLEFAEREVMARQILNVGVALDLATRDGIDWLLHMDGDELFFSEEPVEWHFAALTAAGAEVAHYDNFEALPQRPDVRNPFLESSWFKLPPDRPGYDARQCAVLGRIPQFREQFFLSYMNGKSAAQVGIGLTPRDVHSFERRQGNCARVRAASKILHYPSASFELFWRKYRLLDAFSDRWFESVDIRAAVGGFHLDARDVVMQGDMARARAFYETRVMVRDERSLEELQAAELLRRIDRPARVLAMLGACEAS